MKYHILLPRVEDVGGALDYYQWAALLRPVSAFETYRTLYRDQIFPIKVAELQVRLTHADIEEIFQGGLHEYLEECLDDIGELGNRIQRAYLGTV